MRANRGCSAFEVSLGARSGRVGIDFVWQAILFGCVQRPAKSCVRALAGATAQPCSPPADVLILSGMVEYHAFRDAAVRVFRMMVLEKNLGFRDQLCYTIVVGRGHFSLFKEAYSGRIG